MALGFVYILSMFVLMIGPWFATDSIVKSLGIAGLGWEYCVIVLGMCGIVGIAHAKFVFWFMTRKKK